jgi:hypothetical protein
MTWNPGGTLIRGVAADAADRPVASTQAARQDAAFTAANGDW